MENYVSINKSEQSVSGASDNTNFFDKTYSISHANVCSENTLLSDSSNNLTAYQELSKDDSSNNLTAYQKLSTEAPPKSKPKAKTKLPPQKRGSLPLTVFITKIYEV